MIEIVGGFKLYLFGYLVLLHPPPPPLHWPLIGSSSSAKKACSSYILNEEQEERGLPRRVKSSVCESSWFTSYRCILCAHTDLASALPAWQTLTKRWMVV